MILRKAETNEASDVYRCIEDARKYHNSMGFLQWPANYPTINTIQDDIKNEIGLSLKIMEKF